jgi:hypothetical protein
MDFMFLKEHHKMKVIQQKCELKEMKIMHLQK